MKSYSAFRTARIANETSCSATLEHFLSTIESKNPTINAMISVNNDEARKQAAESDKRFADGSARPLEGMVVAVKDNISTKGQRTTCASKILENFVPIYDATVVERLKANGAVIVGKANLDEFAMGSSNENSAFGAVRNPVNTDYVPGGSSGGSAAAVAAEMCHTALGSDTGGSVRLPASFCGVVGLKPTYGRVSRYGLVAYGSSLDQIGQFGSTVEDAALLYDAVNGFDERDATSSHHAQQHTLTSLKEPLSPLTVAVLPEEQLAGCDAEVLRVYHQTLERLKSLGAQVITHAMQYMSAVIPTYYIVATAEASSNLSRYDGVRYGARKIGADGEVTTATRSEGFGAEVKRRIMIGNYVLSSGYYDAYYTKALKVRRLIYNDYKEMFQKADIFLTPNAPTPPFKIGEKTSDPLAMYLEDIFTVSANLGGVPGISIPAGKSSSGLPIGMQLQANHFAEEKLLNVAYHLERAKG
ncbi:MAG: Asp-tRNA(Asn)/Glu-tRNA(Gln) amidotransferase subunit GatA [Candidatus Kapabacteria bacterium]|jgi:aspartyl-tRNA(Asn)/glutamyl-tRNA(Gln) amidotransferase subunit A|nr:Asp-tRNA(Asn)/Glu-tRNA(Gln) amidotransferase subunit GatA [Candidatus Kapabacteria bacterium]